MKVEIKLSEKEFIRLVQLVFLGNYVINGIRNEEEQISAYNKLDRKLTRIEYEVYNKTSGRNAEDNELADLWDRTYDIVQEYLEAFEKDVFRDKLSKWITWENYPIIPGDEISLKKHWAAEEEYIKLIKEQGVRFAQVSAPKIDERLKDASEDESQ